MNKIKITVACLLFMSAMISSAEISAQEIVRAVGSNCVGVYNEFDLNASNCYVYRWIVSSTPSRVIEYEGPQYIELRWTGTGTATITAECVCNGQFQWFTYNEPLVITDIVTPSVSISASTTTFCQTESGNVTFTATPVNGGVQPRYYWRVNGTTITSTTTNTFTRAKSSLNNNDVVSVLMNVDGSICANNYSVTSNGLTMTVTQPVTGSVVVQGTDPICPDTRPSFHATVSNGGSNPVYTWLKNGNPVTDRTSGPPPNIYVPINPVYSGDEIKCRVSFSNSASCITNPIESNGYPVVITPFINPTVNVQTPDGLTYCSGSTITLRAASSYITGSSTYSWRLNGSQFSTSRDTSLPVTTDPDRLNAFSPGDVITVSVSELSGTCLSQNYGTGSTQGVPYVINETLEPSVTVAASSTAICGAESGDITFTATPTNGGSSPLYEWYVGTAHITTTSTNTWARAKSLFSDNERVYVVMRTTAPCYTSSTATSNDITMRVYQPLPFTVSAGGPGTICAGTTWSAEAELSISDEDATYYTWYRNDVIVKEGMGYNTAGTYSSNNVANGDKIKCKAEYSGATCVANTTAWSEELIASITPRITPFVYIDTEESNTSFCEGDNITFEAYGNTALSNFSWTLDNGSAVTTTIPKFTTNQFTNSSTLTVTATASGACLNYNTVSDDVSDLGLNVFPRPNAAISPSGTMTITSDGSVNASATPTGTGYSYEWFKDNQSMHEGGIPTNIPDKPLSASGEYKVKVIQYGCDRLSNNSLVIIQNRKPTANAGTDITVTLPVNSITLSGSGSDADGTTVTYLWNKLSGPDATLSGTNTSTLTLTNVTAGRYLFRLTVSDNLETATDEIVVMAYGDDMFNWVETKALDENGNPYSHSKSYFDWAGKPLQTQTKQFTPGSGKIFASQDLRDRYDRVVGSTLPAPTNEDVFRYKYNFLQTATSEVYSHQHFDNPAANTVMQPAPVGNSAPGTVGWYYSQNNTLEDNVPVTSYPYSRIEFYEDGTGEAKRAASPGDMHRLGMGHETVSGTFPVSNELNEYLNLRAALLPGATQPETLRNEAVQSVGRDVNGRYAVSLADKSGKALMTMLPGTAQDHVMKVDAELTASADPTSPDYRSAIYFYLLQPQKVTITGDDGGACGYPQDIEMRVYNNETEVVAMKSIRLLPDFHVQAGQTFTARIEPLCTFTVEDILSGAKGKTFADASGNWPAGFYRVSVTSGTVTVGFTNYYKDVSCQMYDDVGRPRHSVSPNGFKQWTEGVAVSEIDKTSNTYNHQGWLLSMTEPDAGLTEYAYRKDGNIRFSQNAQQREDRTFSYTNYDELGRPVESGQYTLNANESFANLKTTTLLGAVEDSWMTWGGTKQDWLMTHYDFADEDFYTTTQLPAATYKQEFVDVAVAWTENANMKTWYSYDEQGRVTWMAQKPTGLSRVFVTKYDYGFLGNVLKTSYLPYQNGALLTQEDVYHHYEYDADKRLSKAYTSTDGTTRKLIATYHYYLHGPLKRIELGDNVQGIDFVYNINGWLTQINHPDSQHDPGGDGNDAFGMILDYYESAMQGLFTAQNPARYDGTITSTRWRTDKAAGVEGSDFTGMYTFGYDDKNQLLQAQWATPDFALNSFTDAGNKFRLAGMEYDPNGNIRKLQRYDEAGQLKHNFVYHYENENAEPRYNNKLTSVSGYSNYTYNKIGQMIAEDKTEVSADDQYVEYDVSGKVVKVFSDAGKTQKKVEFIYDDRGFRLAKKSYPPAGEQGETKTIWYIRDAGGTILSIYEQQGEGELTETEVPVYGSGKVGTMYPQEGYATAYELTDHLGNVRALIRPTTTTWTAGFEDADIAAEQADFNPSYDNAVKVSSSIFNYTPGGDKSQRLSAANENEIIGLAKSLTVSPGDVIQMEVYAKSALPSNTNANVGDAILTALSSAFGLSPSSTGIGELAYQRLNAMNNLGLLIHTGEDVNEDVTKAYINYILFDENFVMYDFGFKQLTRVNCGTPEYGLPPGSLCPHEKLELTAVATKTGYAYIYLSNESNTITDVYFDDLKITQTGHRVLQATDYGAWGDIIREQKTEPDDMYRWYYQGQYAERDLETGWDHFELREYDAVIGRWTSTDPMGQHYSPYVGMGNNPVNGTDPDGGYFFGLFGSTRDQRQEARRIAALDEGFVIDCITCREIKMSWYGPATAVSERNAYVSTRYDFTIGRDLQQADAGFADVAVGEILASGRADFDPLGQLTFAPGFGAAVGIPARGALIFAGRMTVTAAGRYALNQSVRNFTSFMTAGELNAFRFSAHAGVRAMMRGKGIDAAFRYYAGKNWILQGASNFGFIRMGARNFGADMIGGRGLSGYWWDVTTNGAWNSHVLKYGSGGTGLIYR